MTTSKTTFQHNKQKHTATTEFTGARKHGTKHDLQHDLQTH
jgi:hypothetical protein